MLPNLRAQIGVETEQIRRLIDDFGPLLERCRAAEPGLFDTAAMATMLHSFYGGVENVLKRIALACDGELPRDPSWHALLLAQSARETPARPAPITPETAEALHEYMTFRHLFRHAYSFDLRWNKIEPLAVDVAGVFDRFQTDIDRFLASLPGGG